MRKNRSLSNTNPYHSIRYCNTLSLNVNHTNYRRHSLLFVHHTNNTQHEFNSKKLKLPKMHELIQFRSFSFILTCSKRSFHTHRPLGGRSPRRHQRTKFGKDRIHPHSIVSSLSLFSLCSLSLNRMIYYTLEYISFSIYPLSIRVFFN